MKAKRTSLAESKESVLRAQREANADPKVKASKEKARAELRAQLLEARAAKAGPVPVDKIIKRGKR